MWFSFLFFALSIYICNLAGNQTEVRISDSRHTNAQALAGNMITYQNVPGIPLSFPSLPGVKKVPRGDGKHCVYYQEVPPPEGLASALRSMTYGSAFQGIKEGGRLNNRDFPLAPASPGLAIFLPAEIPEKAVVYCAE